jgi:DNA mismatch endonuclease (patch repair protein)
MRYRVHARITGHPDLVFGPARVAVFIDGCFWHMCPDHCQMPRTNRPFWRKKLHANVRRDRLVEDSLNAEGWRVLRVWEHAVRADPEAVAKRIVEAVFAARRKRHS